MWQNSFQREGFSKFNKIYEFPCMINGQQCDMTMTSVSGHLLGLDYDEKFRKWWSCDPLALFDLPVFKICKEQSAINIKVSWSSNWAHLNFDIKFCRHWWSVIFSKTVMIWSVFSNLINVLLKTLPCLTLSGYILCCRQLFLYWNRDCITLLDFLVIFCRFWIWEQRELLGPEWPQIGLNEFFWSLPWMVFHPDCP